MLARKFDNAILLKGGDVVEDLLWNLLWRLLLLSALIFLFAAIRYRWRRSKKRIKRTEPEKEPISENTTAKADAPVNRDIDNSTTSRKEQNIFTIEEEWNRQKLVDSGLVSGETARMMMVYQVLAPENVAFDPSRDKLTFHGGKLYCGFCLTNVSQMPGTTPEPVALDDFTLRFKGPLSAESKHLAACPKCGSRIQICGDILETPTGAEPIVTLYPETSPSRQLPRLIVGQIELVSSHEVPAVTESGKDKERDEAKKAIKTETIKPLPMESTDKLYQKNDIIAMAIVYEGHLPEGYTLDKRELASEIMGTAHQHGLPSEIKLSPHTAIRAQRANEAAYYEDPYKPTDDLPTMLQSCVEEVRENIIANGGEPGLTEVKSIQFKTWSSVASTSWVGIQVKQ
jgi:hypothetical protein